MQSASVTDSWPTRQHASAREFLTPNAAISTTPHPRNYTWAELMKRVWALDVLECPVVELRIICNAAKNACASSPRVGNRCRDCRVFCIDDPALPVSGVVFRISAWLTKVGTYARARGQEMFGSD